MNPSFERAQLLIQQGRFAMAEEQLRRALIADPENPLIHSTLAAALLGQERKEDALIQAREAIVRGPDIGYCHYVHAVVLKSMDRLDESLTAISVAIQREPGDPAYWGVMAGIHTEKKRWKEALEAADQGMRIDPENEQCVNLRAIALVHLNRRAEAGETIDAALGNNPHSAVTHANMGWTLLHKGDPTTAMTHFREALRIDPTQEWARAGIVEALKARNFIYRMFLGYALWLSRLSAQVRWGVIIGMVVLMQFVQLLPTTGPLFWVGLGLMVAYFVFVLTVWTAEPLFNLLLRFDRFGRLVLSDEQRKDSTWMGVALVLIIGLVGTMLWKGRIDFAIACLFLAVPVGVTLSVPRTAWRIPAGLVTAGLFVVAGLCWKGWFGFEWPFDPKSEAETGAYLAANPDYEATLRAFIKQQKMYKDIVMWGCVAMSWLAPMFHARKRG